MTTFVSAASYSGKKLVPYVNRCSANLERTLLLSTDPAATTPVQGLLSIWQTSSKQIHHIDNYGSVTIAPIAYGGVPPFDFVSWKLSQNSVGLRARRPGYLRPIQDRGRYFSFRYWDPHCLL